LNKLPLVKAFLKGPALQYENLEVKYTHGSPRAIFFSGEKEVEKIQLAGLNGDEIGSLLQSKGIKLKSQNRFHGDL